MNPLVLLKLWTFCIFCKERVNLWAELYIYFVPVSLFLCLFLSSLAFSLTLTLLWLLFSAPLECAGVLMPYGVRTLCWAVGSFHSSGASYLHSMSVQPCECNRAQKQSRALPGLEFTRLREQTEIKVSHVSISSAHVCVGQLPMQRRRMIQWNIYLISRVLTFTGSFNRLWHTRDPECWK